MIKSATILLWVLGFCCVYGQDIPQSGLVGYWKLDEGAGSATADASGFGATGELMGSADWVDGYMGKAIEFDGIDSYVLIGTGDGQYDMDYGLTLSIWVYQTEMGHGQHDPWMGKGDHAYAIKYWSGNMYEFFIYTTDWVSCHAEIDEAHLFEWHHFAGTYDGAEMKMYIDGELVATVEHNLPINITEHDLTLGWNSDPTAAGRFFPGRLDEAMIYNVALTEDEIKQLYNVKSEVMHERTLANQFRLQQNYPNPFNPVTTISYTIPATLPVTLKIYDARGHQVQTLVNERQTIGTHSAVFDASALPSGIYFYKIEAGDRLTETRKMMLIK